MNRVFFAVGFIACGALASAPAWALEDMSGPNEGVHVDESAGTTSIGHGNDGRAETFTHGQEPNDSHTAGGGDKGGGGKD